MGNQMSIPQRIEDPENDGDVGTYKVVPDRACDQNGVPVIVSTHTVTHYDEVDLGISLQKDNVAASSPGTTEIGATAPANGETLGKEASPEAPAAKSRFFLTFSRPVPGRTGDRGPHSSAQLDVSPGEASANKGPSEQPPLPGADAPAPGRAEDKSPARTPAPAGSAHHAPEAGAAAASKPRDTGFLDRFFKLDKGQDKTAVDSQQETQRSKIQEEAQGAPGGSGPCDAVPTEKDIVDGKQTEGQEIATLSCPVPGDPEGQEVTKEDSQTTDITDNNNSIMSFFKTLVSPNKAEAKKDPEDTASRAESVCDGQAGAKTPEPQAQGGRKKRLDSPRIGLAFRKFFRHKDAENSANGKSDKANFTPQDTQGAAPGPRGCGPPGRGPSGTVTDTAKEGGKEKTGPTSLPLGKLFWKKSVKEESVPTGAQDNVGCEPPVETIKFEEVESALQTVDLNEDGEARPERKEAKLKREESQPRRTSLRLFLRQRSVKGDDGTTRSEDINGKDVSCQTSNATEKATTPPEPEPTGAAPRGKETPAKDSKKPAAEGSKQESPTHDAREPAPGTEPAPAAANALQNGDKSQKRPEKRRQSLGGFLKGLGPKRMLDAQVQTDPVSIGPAGKPKCTGKCVFSLAKKTWPFQERR